MLTFFERNNILTAESFFSRRKVMQFYVALFMFIYMQISKIFIIFLLSNKPCKECDRITLFIYYFDSYERQRISILHILNKHSPHICFFLFTNFMYLAKLFGLNKFAQYNKNAQR